MSRGLRALGLVCTTLLLSGCISYRQVANAGHNHLPTPAQLEQIQPGITSSDWLITHLGHPDAIQSDGITSALWQYQATSQRGRHFRALPLLAIELNTIQRVVHNFEVEGGMVVRHWRESNSE